MRAMITFTRFWNHSTVQLVNIKRKSGVQVVLNWILILNNIPVLLLFCETSSRTAREPGIVHTALRAKAPAKQDVRTTSH